MSRARDTSKRVGSDRLGKVENEDVFEADFTVAANNNVAIVGPVTIPNVTINGNLNAMKSLNVTGTLSFGSAGMLNIIG